MSGTLHRLFYKTFWRCAIRVAYPLELYGGSRQIELKAMNLSGEKASATVEDMKRKEVQDPLGEHANNNPYYIQMRR